MRPCLKCLFTTIVRKRAGFGRVFCILQCDQCGFNITGRSWKEVEAAWNDFKVWDLVDQLRSAAVPQVERSKDGA